MNESIIIFGAGPAGVAAAVQLKRYGHNPLLLQKGKVGGLLHNAGWVENYPGFAEGIAGVDLAALLADHLHRWAVRLRHEEVEELERAGDGYRIRTSEQVYFSQCVIIATGTMPKRFVDFPLPEAVLSRIFYEVRDLPAAHGKQIVIVGGGDCAFDYALQLAAANEVGLLCRGEAAGALPLLRERAAMEPGISLYLRTTLEMVSLLAGRLVLQTIAPEGRKTLRADQLVFAIGREPALDFLVYNLKELKSPSNGLYFCGDVVNGQFRQAAISAGDGLRTAMMVNDQMHKDTE